MTYISLSLLFIHVFIFCAFIIQKIQFLVCQTFSVTYLSLVLPKSSITLIQYSAAPVTQSAPVNFAEEQKCLPCSNI